MSDDLVREADQELEAMSSALRNLQAIAKRMGREGATEELLSLLYSLRSVQSDAREAYKKIEAETMPVMGERKLSIAPYGEFVSHRGMKRTEWRWRPTDDQPGLIDVIVARCADDWTGEPPAVFAQFVADELAACIGFSQGKVGGLKARGITPADFCNEQPKAWSLQLPKKVSEDDLGGMGEDDAPDTEVGEAA